MTATVSEILLPAEPPLQPLHRGPDEIWTTGELTGPELRYYHRRIFRAAYAAFREMATVVSTARAQNLELSLLRSAQCRQDFSDPMEPCKQWLCDFHLAGKRVLRGREERIFSLHFCMGLSRDLTMKDIGLRSRDTWNSLCGLIAEKVGGQLLRDSLWPLHTDGILRGYFG